VAAAVTAAVATEATALRFQCTVVNEACRCCSVLYVIRHNTALSTLNTLAAKQCDNTQACAHTIYYGMLSVVSVIVITSAFTICCSVSLPLGVRAGFSSCCCCCCCCCDGCCSVLAIELLLVPVAVALVVAAVIAATPLFALLCVGVASGTPVLLLLLAAAARFSLLRLREGKCSLCMRSSQFNSSRS
jgi:hypothetical protein